MAAAGKSIYLFALVTMLKLGIDIGSRNTKIVIYNDSKEKIEFSACHSTELSILDGVNHLIARLKLLLISEVRIPKLSP